MPLKEWLVFFTEYAIVIIDGMALVLVVVGSVEAFGRAAVSFLVPTSPVRRREIWLRFARILVAALTFQLAADIIETSVSASWDAILRIAVIAVVRTFLNYFLERDFDEVQARQGEVASTTNAL